MGFMELVQAYPLISIIVMSVLVSLFVSIVQYFVLDKDKVRELKAKQKSIQDEIKLNKDNPTRMMELQKEMMGHTMESFKHTLKPTLITTVPLLILFVFIRKWFDPTAIAHTWIWWYIGAAFAASLLFRKLFKLP